MLVLRRLFEEKRLKEVPVFADGF
jgi:hypothetical protein